MRAPRRGQASGFSLLESIFSFVILSVVLMVLFNLYPSSMLAVRRAEQGLQADTLAGSLLEERRALPFSSLTVGTEALAPVTANGISYEPSVEVFPVPGTDPARLKGLRARVRWMDRGRQREVVHELWVADVRR